MVKKDMKDKVQVSMWIQTPLKHLVDNEDLNLTKFVNSGLETYFSVSNTKKIESEILAKSLELQVLEQRLKDFKAKEVSVDSQEKVDNIVLNELKDTFGLRGGPSALSEMDGSWIRSPKNLSRCKALGKSPEEVLVVLEEWWKHEEKNRHEKD